jgi:hypothetical protein
MIEVAGLRVVLPPAVLAVDGIDPSPCSPASSS